MSEWAYLATVVFWIAALISLRAATKTDPERPRTPRALSIGTTERILGAMFVTVYAVLFWNTDHGYPWWDMEQAKMIGRAAPVLFVAKPLLFILAYALNWFRDEDYREAGRRLSR